MPIISVNNIGKKYNISHRQGGYLTLRDALSNAFGHPLRFMKQKAKAMAGLAKKEEFWALKDVSFSVEPGEVVGIIGHNGAGKSTLLKILSQITPPTEGEIAINGRVGSLLEVGTGFHPELTGRENIFLNGAILGMTRQEIAAKFDQIVEFSGVEKFLDTPVKYYSSGMYVRLAFSVAAHLEPDVLIIDEVLAVGDADFQKKCLGKMDEITKKEGRTILFVSHNLQAIKSICQKCILLEGGKIKTMGSVDEVISYYLSDPQKASYSVVWPESTAPKNNSIVLKKIAVVGSNGNLLKTIPAGSDFNIEIDYELKFDTVAPGFTLGFWNSQNDLIFVSISNREENFYGKKVAAGNYKTICHLPKGVFNEGLFSLSLTFFEENFSNSNSLSNIIVFKVEDDAYGRNDYVGDYPGNLRLLLDWQTKLID